MTRVSATETTTGGFSRRSFITAVAAIFAVCGKTEFLQTDRTPAQGGWGCLMSVLPLITAVMGWAAVRRLWVRWTKPLAR